MTTEKPQKKRRRANINRRKFTPEEIAAGKGASEPGIPASVPRCGTAILSRRRAEAQRKAASQ